MRAWGDGKTIELCFVVLVVRIRAREAYREDEAPNPVPERGVWRLRVCGRFETAYCALWLTPKFICFTPFIVSNVIVLMKKVRSSPRGTGPQLFIADQISEGAIAFFKTEYTYLVPFVVVCAAFIVGILEGQSDSPVSYSSKKADGKPLCASWPVRPCPRWLAGWE